MFHEGEELAICAAPIVCTILRFGILLLLMDSIFDIQYLFTTMPRCVAAGTRFLKKLSPIVLKNALQGSFMIVITIRPLVIGRSESNRRNW